MKKIFIGIAFCAFGICLNAQKQLPKIVSVDAHSHVDIPMERKDMPGIAATVDLKEGMRKAGIDILGMTFAVDYVQLKYKGHAWERFQNALDGQDLILSRSGIKRALTSKDIKQAKKAGEPIVIQSVEGGHFLEGDVARLQQAYDRGLRIFCLLHDNDATPALGDVYTNTPQFGGLTQLGADAIRESERLGILVDLAHCDSATLLGALRVATKPIIITHTGLNTRLNGEGFMAKMMYKRLISPELARKVAQQGGVIGVWPHLANTAQEYAENIKAMVDVVGIDHVCIGSDTKVTTEIHEWEPRPGQQVHQPEHEGEKKEKKEGKKGSFKAKDPNAVNHVFDAEPDNFYASTIRSLLALGYKKKDIEKICSKNFLRVFDKATKK